MLPRDVINMVERYNREDDINVIKEVSNNNMVLTYLKLLVQFGGDKQMNDYFKNNNIDVRVVNDGIKVGEVRKLTDQELYDILFYLAGHIDKFSSIVNSALRQNGKKFRVVEYVDDTIRGQIEYIK